MFEQDLHEILITGFAGGDQRLAFTGVDVRPPFEQFQRHLGIVLLGRRCQRIPGIHDSGRSRHGLGIHGSAILQDQPRAIEVLG